MGGVCSKTWRKIKNSYGDFVGIYEEKRPQGMCRQRWDYNIKVDLKEVRYVVVDGIHLAQVRLL
jgi:hypothetical protein